MQGVVRIAMPAMLESSLGVGTTPNARKNPYLVLDFYEQDWHWMGSIFNLYPCDLVSLY